MFHPFQRPALPLVILTDLDGTLLDHHDYSFAAAAPAMDDLRTLGVPVVVVSSKTLPEVHALLEELGLRHPCVLENGALVSIPEGYFGATASLIRLSPDYPELCQWLHRLRDEKGYSFTGFSDMQTDELADRTGLSPEKAAMAKAREGSEPFVWEDTEQAFERFLKDVEAAGWRCLQGGRFYHLLGNTDKAAAVEHLLSHYREIIGPGMKTVALGDSPNDLPMLAIADTAVIIRRHDGSLMDFPDGENTLKTRQIGPHGWNEAIHYILTEQESKPHV